MLHEARLAAVAAALACLVTAPAQAQYLGAGIGPSKIEIDCTGSTSCDTTDTGWKVYAGWTVAAPLALELTYFNWGKAHSTAVPAGGGTSSLDTKAKGFGLGVAYMFTFGWGQCVARAGYARNSADTVVTLNGAATASSHDLSTPYAGFGCLWPASPHVAITLDYDRSRAAYTATDKANTHLLSLGIRWH